VGLHKSREPADCRVDQRHRRAERNCNLAPALLHRMVEWSYAFGGVPVYIHEADRDWDVRPDAALRSWSGDTYEIASGVTLIRCGGHFEGSTILHWAGGAEGRGAVLSGDTLQVVPDRSHLAFMRSYPNYIPLGAAAVQSISERMSPWEFEAVYGAFWNATILSEAKDAFQRSVIRHLAWLDAELGDRVGPSETIPSLLP
jgi:hypothetical protein